MRKRCAQYRFLQIQAIHGVCEKLVDRQYKIPNPAFARVVREVLDELRTVVSVDSEHMLDKIFLDFQYQTNWHDLDSFRGKLWKTYRIYVDKLQAEQAFQ